MAKAARTKSEILALTSIQPNGCVEWTGSHDPAGYGRVWFRGKARRAHRVIYEMLAGPISGGLPLDHLCRNTSCVAPAHLEPVSDRENLLRGDTLNARNAAKTHCKNGHPFDGPNTSYYLRKGSVRRQCKRCAVANTQRYYARKGGQR